MEEGSHTDNVNMRTTFLHECTGVCVWGRGGVMTDFNMKKFPESKAKPICEQNISVRGKEQT